MHFTIEVEREIDKRWIAEATHLLDAIESLGLKKTDFEALATLVAPAMKRRHRIVHNSDRNRPNKTDHGKPQGLNDNEVAHWARAVGSFENKVVEKIQESTPKRIAIH
ncbi:MAG TPA: hypothetical protein VGN88_04080 [Phycisphaerae bacterium]|jgi:hypothetical protein